MPWPLPSAKIYGHDATMRGFRTELHESASPPSRIYGGPHGKSRGGRLSPWWRTAHPKEVNTERREPASA